MPDAWDFFSRPENLDILTPPEMAFQILGGDLPRMFAGQIICYRIRLAPMLWVRWVTEITHVEEGRSFVDEQRAGPYKFWHHRHSFRADGPDHIVMDDLVHYALPFGPLGSVAHAAYVRRQLARVFAYRRQVLADRFGESEGEGES